MANLVLDAKLAPANGLQQRLSRAADLVDVIEHNRHPQAEALALACHFEHPVHDCLVLALAQRLADRVLP